MQEFDREIKREMNEVLPNINFTENDKQRILQIAEKKTKNFPLFPVVSIVAAFGIFALLTFSFLPDDKNPAFSPTDKEIVEQKPEDPVQDLPDVEITEEKTPEPETQVEETQPGIIEKELLRSLSNYHFIMSDNSRSYEVFLYLNDTASLSEAVPDYVPHVNDWDQNNEFKLFLAEMDSPIAHQQIHLAEELSRMDLTKDYHYTVLAGDLGTNTLLSFFKELNVDNYNFGAFIVDNGKLEILGISEQAGTLLRGAVKIIERQYLQTVHYLPEAGAGESRYEYRTWRWDKEEKELEFFDRTTVGPVEAEDYVLTGWKESDIHSEYVDFKTISFTKELISNAHEGKLQGFEFSIGDNIQQVKENRTEQKSEGTYEGARFVSYLEGSYFSNLFTDEIIVLSIGGNKMKITKKEIIEILGEPDEDGFSDKDGYFYFIYKFGDYCIFLTHYNEEDYVSLELREYQIF